MKRAIGTAAVLLLVILVAGGAFLARGHSQPEKRQAAAPADAGRPADEQPEPARSAEEPVRPAEPRAEAGAAAPAEPRKGAAEERTQLLETIGSLTAAHYFQTYLNIGFIADGKAAGTYSDKDARRVLDSVMSLVNSLDQKLDALARVDLERGDRDRLEQLRAASALLRQQAKELQAFWDSGKPENATRYENLRKSAWATISKQLGVAP